MGLKLEAQPASIATAMQTIGARGANRACECIFMLTSDLKFEFGEFGRLKKNPGNARARDNLNDGEKLSRKIKIELGQLGGSGLQSLSYSGLCNDRGVRLLVLGSAARCA